MNKIYSEPKPVVVDLFSGAGGFSLAAVQAGFSIAIAIENDPYAVKTYKANLLQYDAAKNATVLDESILGYTPEDVRSEYLGDIECDLL
ncbi:DNA cytosine methyltransferase [Pseudomonas parakoreensis]